MPADPLLSNVLTAFALLNTASPAVPKKKTRKLRMNTLRNARRSVTRLIKDFDADPASDPDRFRALMAAFRVLLNYDVALAAAGKGDDKTPGDAEGDPDMKRLTPEEQLESERLFWKLHGIENPELPAK